MRGGICIKLGFGVNRGIFGGSAGLSFSAPFTEFEFTTDPDSDNTQNLVTTVYQDIEGYYIRTVGTFGSATVSEPYDIDDASNIIDAAEALALATTFTTGAIPDGLISFKQRIEDGDGNARSDWGNTVTKTIFSSAFITWGKLLAYPVNPKFYSLAGVAAQSTSLTWGKVLAKPLTFQ